MKRPSVSQSQWMKHDETINQFNGFNAFQSLKWCWVVPILVAHKLYNSFILICKCTTKYTHIIPTIPRNCVALLLPSKPSMNFPQATRCSSFWTFWMPPAPLPPLPPPWPPPRWRATRRFRWRWKLRRAGLGPAAPEKPSVWRRHHWGTRRPRGRRGHSTSPTWP